MARLSASATAGEGAVRVTVAASGAVTDLRLAEAVRQWPAARIAEQILATMRRAQGELSGLVAQAAVETVGAESSFGRQAVRSYAERFPAPPADSQRESTRDNRSGFVAGRDHDSRQ